MYRKACEGGENAGRILDGGRACLTVTRYGGWKLVELVEDAEEEEGETQFRSVVEVFEEDVASRHSSQPACELFF